MPTYEWLIYIGQANKTGKNSRLSAFLFQNNKMLYIHTRREINLTNTQEWNTFQIDIFFQIELSSSIVLSVTMEDNKNSIHKSRQQKLRDNDILYQTMQMKAQQFHETLCEQDCSNREFTTIEGIKG